MCPRLCCRALWTEARAQEVADTHSEGPGRPGTHTGRRPGLSGCVLSATAQLCPHRLCGPRLALALPPSPSWPPFLAVLSLP